MKSKNIKTLLISGYVDSGITIDLDEFKKRLDLLEKKMNTEIEKIINNIEEQFALLRAAVTTATASSTLNFDADHQVGDLYHRIEKNGRSEYLRLIDIFPGEKKTFVFEACHQDGTKKNGSKRRNIGRETYRRSEWHPVVLQSNQPQNNKVTKWHSLHEAFHLFPKDMNPSQKAAKILTFLDKKGLGLGNGYSQTSSNGKPNTHLTEEAFELVKKEFRI